VAVVVVVAVVAAAAGPAAAAQGKRGSTQPTTGISGALDFVGRALAPDAPEVEATLRPQGLTKTLGVTVAERAISVKYGGALYALTPCPDVHGTAHASTSVDFTVLDGGGAEIWLSQVNLEIDVAVNDNAGIANVTVKGRVGEGRMGTATGGGTYGDFNYDRAGKQLDATVTNSGPSKKASQQRLNTIAKQGAALADEIAQKLKAVWQDGKTCVTLGVTPASRSVKPKDKLSVEVTSSAADGSKITRPITAKLTGATKIEPATSKSAPGSFQYIAPAKKGDKGHVMFEQRSKRGIGRAEVDYGIGDKVKLDFEATKVAEACLGQICNHASLFGLSATVELVAEGAATSTGTATLLYSSESSVGFSTNPADRTGRCNTTNSYSVPMTVTVTTEGDTLTARATSDSMAIQTCTGGGQSEVGVQVIVNAVSVPADGGNNAATDNTTGCLIDAHELAQTNRYICTYTLTATKVSD
jgi:hypothetical protein